MTHHITDYSRPTWTKLEVKMCWKYWTGGGLKAWIIRPPRIEISNKLGGLALWARGFNPSSPLVKSNPAPSSHSPFPSSYVISHCHFSSPPHSYSATASSCASSSMSSSPYCYSSLLSSTSSCNCFYLLPPHQCHLPLHSPNGVPTGGGGGESLRAELPKGRHLIGWKEKREEQTEKKAKKKKEKDNCLPPS